MTTKEEDFVNEVFVVNTLTPLLFFSSMGIVYKLKTHKIPSGSPTSKGKALVNLLPLRSGEKITTTMPYNLSDKKNNIIFATSLGNIRRNKLNDFHNINANGKIVTCPNRDYVVDKSDFLLCTVPMEYDQFLQQSMNAVRHARGKDNMKERRELLRSTHRLILQQLQAVESILERVNYVLRKTENEDPVQIGVDQDNNDETLSESAENLLNAVIGVRKTLREKQHVLKGIALEKSESVEAAEVVFQQVTINHSLMNILEEKCIEIQRRCI